eukprot:3723012-Rhodomonas_salina.3
MVWKGHMHSAPDTTIPSLSVPGEDGVHISKQESHTSAWIDYRRHMRAERGCSTESKTLISNAVQCVRAQERKEFDLGLTDLRVRGGG